MKHLSSFFDKYKKTIKAPQASVEKEVVSVIKEVVGIEIKFEQITYMPASRTVTLQAPSIVRSEVLKYKADILTKLNQSLGVANSPHYLR